MTALNSTAAQQRPAPAGALRREGPTPVSTLADARDMVEVDDAGKWDTLVPREELALRGGKLALPIRSCGDDMRLTLSPWATGQLCTRLGIPASYFRRCPAILQDTQANWWLRNGIAPQSKVSQRVNCSSESPGESDANNGEDGADERGEQPWRLRAKNDRVRAILSSRYSPLDNETLMKALMPLLHSRHRVDWFGLSPETFHLRVIDPSRTRDILPGDGIAVGVHIANSEVGFRSITVDALVYRLICSNGLVRLEKGKSLLRQRHIHLEHSRFVSILENAVADAFVTAEEFVEQLRNTIRVPVPNVEGAIESYGKLWNLPESTTETAKTMLLSEPAPLQETLYGLVNAFTAAAQRLPDEHRYDLEVLAGHLAGYGVDSRVANGARSGALPGDHSVSAIMRAKELFGAEIVGSRLREPATTRE